MRVRVRGRPSQKATRRRRSIDSGSITSARRGSAVASTGTSGTASAALRRLPSARRQDAAASCQPGCGGLGGGALQLGGDARGPAGGGHRLGVEAVGLGLVDGRARDLAGRRRARG